MALSFSAYAFASVNPNNEAQNQRAVQAVILGNHAVAMANPTQACGGARVIPKSQHLAEPFNCVIYGYDANSVLTGGLVELALTYPGETAAEKANDVASEKQRKACVAWAIKDGANPNGTDSSMNPLIMALQNGDGDNAKLLIQYGANLNAMNSYGVTPVVEASITQSDDILALMLNAGANPNPPDTSHASALNVSAGLADIAAVRTLLAHGANVNMVYIIDANNPPATPLDASTDDLSMFNSYKNDKTSDPGLAAIDASSIVDLHGLPENLRPDNNGPAPTDAQIESQAEQIGQNEQQVNAMLKSAGAKCAGATCGGLITQTVLENENNDD
jgi:hypothetical protein